MWTQQGTKLVGTGAIGNNIFQGASVAISSDGNTAFEGGTGDNNNLGAVWVFTRSGNVWTQQGTKLFGTGSVGNNTFQGRSVSTSSDGNTAIEGGYGDNSTTGAVWIFTRSGGIWTQQGPKLVATGEIGHGYFGLPCVISSNGNNAVVGASLDSTGTGAVWVFNRSNGIWTQQGTKLIGTGAVGGATQGISVAISSEGTLIEGGNADNTFTGAVWVFFNPSIGITPISGEVPKNFSLSQNYPNPFNPATKIKFDLPEGNGDKRFVLLKIYDVLGREVSTLVNQQLQPGTYEVNFDAANFESVVYFYKLTSGGFTETKKMVLIK